MRKCPVKVISIPGVTCACMLWMSHLVTQKRIKELSVSIIYYIYIMLYLYRLYTFFNSSNQNWLGCGFCLAFKTSVRMPVSYTRIPFCQCALWDKTSDDSRVLIPTILVGNLDWVSAPSLTGLALTIAGFGKWVKSWE